MTETADMTRVRPTDDDVADGLTPLRAYWHPVVRAEDVGDAPVGVTLLGERVVLVRTAAGVSAFHDLCLHRGAKISMGRIEGPNVVCPYHGFAYDGVSGRCVHIPSQPRDDQHIPSRLRLERYRCEERHGLLWVALDDPIAPLPEFPEAGDAAYRTHYGFSRMWKTSAARYTKNAMDLSHFPFVHAGTLGDPDHPEMHPFAVDRTETGLRYQYEWDFQRPEFTNHYGGPVNYEYEVDLPFTVRIRLVTPNGRTVIFSTACPVTEDRTHLWVLFARDHSFDRPDHEWTDFSIQIWSEDQEVVEEQRPERLPVDLTAEVHLRAPDAAGIAYRGLLRDIGLSHA
jgi:vanillate O-demethylase monooxygenase subunit